MKSACFRRKPQTNRPGFIVLLMLLIIVVVCGLVWLGPFELSGSKDESLPWNQLKRIVPDDEVVPSPTEQQPKFTTHMGIIAECKENGQDRGEVTITSDKKTYFEYEFSGKLVETLPFPFDLPTGSQFQEIPSLLK